MMFSRLERLLLIVGLIFMVGIATAVAQLVTNPPVPNITINGHTYTDAQLRADPGGWFGGLANDMAIAAAQYPSGPYSPRVILGADLIMYIAPSGSDSNNCLISNPCQTIQATYNKLRDGYDLHGKMVTIHLAPGNYAGFIDSSQLLGQTSPEQLVVTGDSAAVASTVINGVQLFVDFGALVTASYSGSFRLRFVTLTTSVAGAEGIYANRGGVIFYDGVAFGSIPDCQILADERGEAQAMGSYSITGGAAAHMCASALGLMVACRAGIACAVTITNNPTFSVAFAAVNVQGQLEIFPGNLTFSGPATGMRYAVDTGGLIDTFGQGPNKLPGTIAGQSGATGGQYL